MYGRSYTIWGQEVILTILSSFSHVQLLRPQPAGLLSPRDFPGKNTRVGLLFPPPNHLFHDKALPWQHLVQPDCFIKALWFDLLEHIFKIISTQIWLLTKLLLLTFSYFTSFLTANIVPLHVVHENPVLCLVAQPCLTLCDPVDCSPWGSSVHGRLQARKLEWVAMPSSRGSSQPRDWTQVSFYCRQILYHLSHPFWLKGVVYPFSRGTSQPRSRTGISYMRILSEYNSIYSTILYEIVTIYLLHTL